MLHLARLILGPILALGLAFVMALPAAAFDTRARAAFVIDATTGTVLLLSLIHI